MDKFCNLSGLKISLAKSKFFCSPYTNQALVTSISEEMGIPSTNNLGKYFGFPIFYGRKSKAEYNFIVEKAKLKLAGWKASLLLMAGRTTLVTSVLAAIPNYFMQTTSCLWLHVITLIKLVVTLFGGPQLIIGKSIWLVGIKLLNLRSWVALESDVSR